MKLLIVGTRGIIDFDLSAYVTVDVDTIISGGSSGIDTLAERYADEHALSKFIIRPQYHKYGRVAPLKRNEIMVDMADAVIAVWDGVSNGTKYTINYAKKLGKPITVISYN